MSKLFITLASILWMLLGILHTVAYLAAPLNDPVVNKVLNDMNGAVIHFFGEHTVLQLYNGFSLTMGFLLFVYGLSAFVVQRPDKRTLMVNIPVSFAVLALTERYFHILASGFMLAALICFIISAGALLHEKNKQDKLV